MTKPNTEWLNRTEVAALFDVDVRHVARLARAGRIKCVDHVRYDADLCREDAKRRQELAGLREARRRLMVARARLAEMAVVERRAELVPAIDAERVAREYIETARTRILRLADDLAPMLAGMDDPSECAKAISAAVNHLLADLSGDHCGIPAYAYPVC